MTIRIVDLFIFCQLSKDMSVLVAVPGNVNCP